MKLELRKNFAKFFKKKNNLSEKNFHVNNFSGGGGVRNQSDPFGYAFVSKFHPIVSGSYAKKFIRHWFKTHLGQTDYL